MTNKDLLKQIAIGALIAIACLLLIGIGYGLCELNIATQAGY